MPKNSLRFNADQLPLLGGGVVARGVGGGREVKGRGVGVGVEGTRSASQKLVEFPLNGQ